MKLTLLQRLFHTHKWVVVDAAYTSLQHQLLAIAEKQSTRSCYCGVMEIEKRTCLGLNPPKYISEWRKQ